MGFVTEMPRTYNKRSLGSRRYADYSVEKFQERLDQIRKGAIPHRMAEAKYNIPRRTILNKLKGKHANNLIDKIFSVLMKKIALLNV